MAHLKFDILVNEVVGFPALHTYIEANFAGEGNELLDLLLMKAEDSPYPLRQWVEALVRFQQWLDTHQLSHPIVNQISYVACSAEAGSAYATLTQLPDQLFDMLENYGCDDAEPIK